MNVQFEEIATEAELLRVLTLFPRILGDHPQELYGVYAWAQAAGGRPTAPALR